MSTSQPIRVLFVCTGNICRSPMAEAIFQKLARDAGLSDRFEIASVGTDDEDIGLPIHRGTRAVLQQHGIPYSNDKRATLVTRADVEEADYTLAMTRQHLSELQALRPARSGEMRLLMDFVPSGEGRDIPDPYYTRNFDEVYAMISAGCQGLLAHIREHEQL
jgi:protein-tyrosine phosphatase